MKSKRYRSLPAKSILSVSSLVFLVLISLGAGAISLSVSTKAADFANESRIKEKQRILLSYVNMMIKQNDESSAVISAETLGLDGFIIKNYASEPGLNAAIYFDESAIYENLYFEDFDFELSEKIVDIEQCSFEVDSKYLKIKIKSLGGYLERIIAFRSKGESSVSVHD